MAEAKRQIFRKESLERLHNAEELDQLLHVVQPRSWWTLGAAAAVLGLALMWGFLGRIPITVEGVAFLTHPDRILPFQATVRGQVLEVHVSANQTVEKGQLLAELRLPELDSQIKLQQQRVERATLRRDAILEIRKHFATSDKVLLSEQFKELKRRIGTTIQSSRDFERASKEAFIELRDALAAAKGITDPLLVDLHEFQKDLIKLSEPGPVSAKDSEKDDQGSSGTKTEAELGSSVSRLEVLQNLIRLTDQQLRGVEQTSREKQLALEETREGLTLAAMLDRQHDLEAAMSEVEIELDAVDKRIEIDELENKLLLDGLEAELELLKRRHEEQSRVLASAAGTVVEVLHHPGELVEVGERLGRIELADDGAGLKAVAYFPVDAGKRVEVGDELRVTPDTVERARYGGILAKVEEVTRFPVSPDAAAHRLGGPELAQLLLAGQSRIEVVALLEASPEFESGYRWSSGRGPDEPVTEGTTARARVTIERRAPITFVLPFLESWLDPEG